MSKFPSSPTTFSIDQHLKVGSISLLQVKLLAWESTFMCQADNVTCAGH